MFDNLAYLAMMAFGLGLSLATYRLFALRNSWPMGAFHADLPAVPIMIGLMSIVVAVLFAASVGDARGWMIVGLGFVLWIVWVSVMRVGSQLSLFLAPLRPGCCCWAGSVRCLATTGLPPSLRTRANCSTSPASKPPSGPELASARPAFLA